MFSFKNFKILLLLLLFAFAGQNVWAGGSSDFSISHDSHLQVKVVTGGGKVYAKENNKGEESAPSLTNCVFTEMTAALTNTKNSANRPANFYILAMPDEGYEFDYWECTKNEGDADTDKANAVGTKLTVDNSLQQTGNTWKVKAALSKRPGATSSSSGSESSVINAVWEAHFKRIITQAVDVQSENNSLGTATINKGSNTIGDEIMLTASCASTNVMFKGWYRINEDTGQKEFVNDNNPYSFIIEEGNKGTYYARFEDGYYFWRLKNNDTQHYVTSCAHFTGEAIPANLNSALTTQLGLQNDLASSITDAGTMMDIYVKGEQASTYNLIWDIYVQDEHTSQYYDEAPGSGAYLAVSHQADNTYLIQSSRFYVIESDGELSASMDLNDIRPYGKWNLEGMDKDVTTKENYFAVAPEEFVGPDANGYYWTTLRVCFNMLYETNEMTPYIVSSVDEENKTMELTEVTGGIIPAKGCVLLKCKSTDVTRNVMVPTRDGSSFNMSNNLLKSSTYYYPNQLVSGDEALKGKSIKKAFIKDGKLAFGGSSLTEVDGNRCYLELSDEVVLPTKAQDITLAELVRSGNTETLYNITDLTAVDAVDHGTMLICKDNNCYADKDENTEQYIDFMHTIASGSGLSSTVPSTYDQSNWIGVRLPGDAEFTASALLGKPLKGVTGKLVNTVNPEFVLDKNSLEINAEGIAAKTDLNPYIAASFYAQNHQTSSVNSKEYFFVQPKPMEMANVEWAQWNGEKFVAPTKGNNNNWNDANLQGEFEFNGSYLEQGGVFLEEGHTYNMIPAVVKLKDNNFDHVYVLGTVNGQNSGEWNPAKGVEMSTRDGNIYIAIVNVDNSGDNFGYFSFTKKLGEAWTDINAYRFGANTESMSYASEYPVDGSNMGNPLPLRDDWSDGTRPFKIAAGTYKLVVDLQAKSLVVSVPVQNAPRLAAEGGKQYVVYPLNITKVTTVENGVITAIDDLKAEKVAVEVVYYNLMGVASDKPHHGINIVETRYSDGSRSAVKVVK